MAGMAPASARIARATASPAATATRRRAHQPRTSRDVHADRAQVGGAQGGQRETGDGRERDHGRLAAARRDDQEQHRDLDGREHQEDPRRNRCAADGLERRGNERRQHQETIPDRHDPDDRRRVRVLRREQDREHHLGDRDQQELEGQDQDGGRRQCPAEQRAGGREVGVGRRQPRTAAGSAPRSPGSTARWPG